MLLILILFFAIFYPFYTYAYSVSAHKVLTEKTIDEFNKISDRRILNIYKEFIKKGVADEDETQASRPLYHFYDPNKPLQSAGLSDASKICKGVQHRSICMSAPLWARDVIEQASYRRDLSSKSKLFSDPNDYTFDRAVYEYVHGDKKRAMEALGHIMHLIQDMTSVPHTRDDAHPNLKGTKLSWLDWYVEDEHSLYEEFTSNKTIRDTNHIDIQKIKTYQNLDTLFYNTAIFTNRNFLSRDTVFEKYTLPRIDKNKVSGNYLYNNVGSKLVLVEKEEDWITGEITAIKSVKLNDSQVLQDYWKHLSYKAVESGVALLELFFREVEKEKRRGELALANISYKEAKRIIEKYKNFKSATSGIRLIATANSENYLDLGDEERYKKLKSAYLADKYYKIMSSKTRREVAQMLKRYESEHAIAKRKKDTQTASALSALGMLDKKYQNIKIEKIKQNQSATNTKKSLNKKEKENTAKQTKTKTKKENKKAPGEGRQVGLRRAPVSQSKDHASLNKKTADTKKQNENTTKDKQESKTANHKSKTQDKEDKFNEKYKFLKYAKLSGAFKPGSFAFGASGASGSTKATKATKTELNPELVIQSLPEYTNKENITIKGQSKNSKETIIYLNGKELARSQSQNWQFDIKLNENENKIKIIAQSDSKNTEKEISIIYDSAPYIEVTCKDAFYQTKSVCYIEPNKDAKISISASADTEELKVNEDTYNKNHTELTVNLKEGQEQTINISAKDKTSTTQKSLTIKAQAPKLSINEYIFYKEDRWSNLPDALWFELKNASDFPLELSQFSITIEDKNKNELAKIPLKGKVDKNSFAIVELSDNLSLSKAPAKIISYDGDENLSNYLFAFAYKDGKNIYLKYKDKVLDSLILQNQAYSYRIQSFEKSASGNFTKHSCTLNAKIELKDKNGKRDSDYACQSLGLENENKFYLSENMGALKEGATYIVSKEIDIQKDESLSIPAGVTLVFASGLDHYNYGSFKAEGELYLKGKDSEKIKLIVANELDGFDEYKKGIPSSTLITLFDIKNNAVFGAEHLSFSGATDKELIKAQEARSVAISHSEIKDKKVGKTNPSISISAKDLQIINSTIYSDANTAIFAKADTVQIENNTISNNKQYATDIEANDSLTFANNKIDGSAKLLFRKFAKDTKITGNIGEQNIESYDYASEAYQNIDNFELINNEQNFYIYGYISLSNMSKFYIENTPISFNVSSRIFADNVSDLRLSDFELNTRYGGFVFQNSNVKIKNAKVSVQGNNKEGIRYQNVSAGLSFVNSKAEIENTEFKDNDKAAIYAENSQITIKSSVFENNEEDIIKDDSSLVVFE